MVAILLEDRFVSGLDHGLEPEASVRRFEVINGAVGRRRWSADDRARILEETLEPGAVISAIARRHGLTPQQLFTWRREARKRAEVEAGTMSFVPAVVAPGPAATMEPGPDRSAAPGMRAAAIEMEAAGVTVRIGNGASPAMIAAVIGALKSTS
ncbi:MAG: transposase [Rhizobiaceae bacterium]